MPKNPPARKYGRVGDAEFSNAKNSKAGYGDKTGTSSSHIPANSDWGFSTMSTHSEPARRSRLGKPMSSSGPKNQVTPGKWTTKNKIDGKC